MHKITLMKRKMSHFQPLWQWQSTGENFSLGLQIIFGYLPYKELCKCALVSKTWRKLALDELRSRCTVNIKCDDHIRFVLENLETSPIFRVGSCIIASQFVDGKLIARILKKLHLTLNILKLETPAKTEDTFILKILANLPNLTRLSVTSICNDNDINNDSASFIGANNWSTPFSYMKVERSQQICNNQINELECGTGGTTDKSFQVVYNGIQYLHFDMGKNGRFQLTKIFHAFPNLLELSVSNVVEDPRKNLRVYSRPKYLKYLRLRQYSNIGFPDKLSQTLIKLDMNLEKLMLILHPPTRSSNKSLQVSSALMLQFIESQGASLNSLKLIQVEDDVCKNSNCAWNWGNNISGRSNSSKRLDPDIDTQSASNCHWNFNYTSPTMVLFPLHLPNLENLHVQKPLITNIAQVVNYFPKLHQLSIQVSHGSNWKGMMPNKMQPHAQLSTLKLDFIDSDSFSRLGQCFPSMQNLQLGYCDESLFNVLCKHVPYFNAETAKKSLISCQECHGSDGQNFGIHADHNGKRKQEDSRTVDAVLNKDDGKNQGSVRHASAALKNLKQLRLRACHHFPYENFVFLRRGSQNPEEILSATDTGETVVGDMTDSDELDSSTGFSWNTIDITNENKFVDLPLNFVESAETCSSA